jgi:4-diphosphocytidyl-2-C-methyl-D-erythritol kinase
MTAVMPICEFARAKVNLTLTVCGRRSDGYHALQSLVVFADIADEIVLHLGRDLAVTTSGPFAPEIAGTNLVDTTLRLLHELGEGLHLGAVALTKNLPVAAGLGGGSADAAAVLRAVRTANPNLADRIAWHEIAMRLGADVPVCLSGRPALMWGIGEKLEPIAGPLPDLPAVLVNPPAPLSTASVFAALRAPQAPPGGRPELSTDIHHVEGLLGVMRSIGNDLEPPATALLPVIAEIKAALAAQAGCHLAALSGSGPTCFGIFSDEATAARATAALATAHPHWWVVATRLAGNGGAPSG